MVLGESPTRLLKTLRMLTGFRRGMNTRVSQVLNSPMNEKKMGQSVDEAARNKKDSISRWHVGRIIVQTSVAIKLVRFLL